MKDNYVPQEMRFTFIGECHLLDLDLNPSRLILNKTKDNCC